MNRPWIAVLLAVGCTREPITLICMNANCTPDADVARDDTLDALRESLTVEWEGRAAFDGIEIDTVWDAAASRCAFSYLYDTAAGADDAHDAAREIAAYLRAAHDPTPFTLKIQAKYRVAPDGRDPSAAELIAHCECDLDLAEIVETAANDAGRPITIIFGEEPIEQAALARRPRWAERWKLMFKISERAPPGVRVDAISIEAEYLTTRDDASVVELQDRGIAVQLWARHFTPAVMDTISATHPDLFDTNDVLSARLWLGPEAAP